MNFKRNIFWVIIFILPIAFLEAKVNPNDIYGNQALYIEINSSNELAKKIEDFYLAFRGNDGKNELELFGKKMKEELSFNLLEKENLEAMGVDTHAKLYFTLGNLESFSKNSDFEDLNPHLYIPTNDSNTLFNIFIEKNQYDQKVDEQTGEIKKIKVGKKISKNIFLHQVGDKKTFFVRHDGFIHITSDDSTTSVAPLQNSLTSDPFYKEFLQKESLLASGVIRIISSSKNSQYKLLSQNSFTQMFPSFSNWLQNYLKEVSGNLKFSIATIDLNSKGFFVNSRSFFQDGYLQNSQSKIYNYLQEQPFSSRLENLKTNPLLFLKFSLNPSSLSSIFSSLRNDSPRLQNFLERLDERLGVNFENEFLSQLNGDFTFNLQEIPPLEEIHDFSKFKVFLSLSVAKEKKSALQKLEKIITHFADFINKSDKNKQMKKASSRLGKFWIGFDFAEASDGLFSVLLNQDELLLSGHPKHLKLIEKLNKTSLMDDYMKKDINEKNILSFILFDVKQFNQYIKNGENYKILKILELTKNINLLLGSSEIEKETDTIKGSFSLQLN